MGRLKKKQHRVNRWIRFINVPNTKQETVAVNILDAINSMACSQTTTPLDTAPTVIANIDTINEATVACTCTNAL